MEEVCFNVTSQLKMQDCKTAMFPNGKLHSIGYNSRPGSRTTFYCSHCEYQRTSSYKHTSSVLNKRSKNGHHSLRTRTFNEIENLSRLPFNMPYFAVSFLNYIVSIFFMTILSRLLSSWRYNCKGTFLHYLLIFYGVSLFSSCNVLGEEVAFMSTQAQRQLIDSFVPVGMGFVYKIPNRIFDCKVQRLEVSEGSSRTLPQWLAFDEGKQTFYGVPSATDIGSYEILVVALAKSDSKTGKICGMKAFTIYVSSEDKSPSFAGPILESVSIAAGSSESLPSTISKHFACFPGLQTVFATVIISADMHELGGHKRMGILRRMAQHMNISFNKLALFHREDKHPLIAQLENPSIIVSGSGDGRYKKGPKSIVTWKISCGALRLGPTYLTELETNAQDGTISNVLGYPVVGWHVTSGVQKAKHRARRAAVAGTPTPTATAILPTQVNNMSTVMITDSISLTTAFVAPNSTLMPSSTLQVSSTVSVAMSSTLPVNTRNFTSNMPITTVAVTSTPVLSSLNLTIFKSVTSSIVNVSSQVDTSSISITANGTSASVMSTVVHNSSVVASSSVTSFVNATSATSSPVLNSSFVLELENTTISILNSSSSIMRSTVYSITPSPSIFLPENSTVVNSTFSTSFPGTNFSATSLNSDWTQKSSVFMSSVRHVNSSTVIPVLPSTLTILPSSVALNSSVFMNQTGTIQPSFQTSTFLSSSPTLTSSLPGNVTNLTSSASLKVSNTSAVILSSTTNATDEVVKTTMVNSSSVVSLVQMLSSLPVMTSVNISTVLPTTVVNTSLVDGVSTSPVFSTSGVIPSGTDNVTMTTVSPSSVVMETPIPYPNVTTSNVSTVPVTSSLNISHMVVSSSGVVMKTESTVVINTQTPYPTVTPSNASTVPLSSSFSPFLSSSLPVVTSSVIVSPNLTSATTTTPLIEKTPAPNVSSLVLTATTVKSSSPAVLPSTPPVLTTSLSTQTIPSSSINSTTAVVSSSVYQALSTVTSVPSLNATTVAAIPTAFSSLSSSSLLEKTRTITSNGTTLYPITTTVLVSSVQPSSTLVVTTSPQVETTVLQSSSVFNSSVTSTFMLSSTMKPSFVSSATSFSILTSVVTSEISTVVIPSITWIENSTVITPFTSDLPHTSSSLISSIVVSSAEISTISLVSQTASTLVPTSPTPNKPPQLHNDIGRLTATAGKVFRYAIPEDVFYDEDGNTSSLTLSLKRINEEFTAEDLGNTSWLVFDPEKQEMYGLPMEKDVPSDPERGEKFLLTARDSAGLVGYDAFEIMIRTSSLAYTQSLSIRLDNDFSAFEQNISQRLDLVSRISGYYGDSDTSQVRVLSYNQGSILFSWINDSLPTDVCNTTQVNYVAEKVIERDGVNTAFKEHLSPEYTVTDASRTLTGVCNATTLPPPLVPDKVVGTESSGLWEKHVLPGIIIAVILIIIAVLLLLLFLRRRRAKPADPEKRTYKKRKPIILEPEMEMKPRSGKPLILENDELSMPPSYMSEMSLDKTLYDDSDDYDEEDYKPTPSRSSPMYETPPPEYIVPRGPLEQPPPAYRLPPTFYSSYTLPPWETSSDV